jgi:hypothetical protein
MFTLLFHLLLSLLLQVHPAAPAAASSTPAAPPMTSSRPVPDQFPGTGQVPSSAPAVPTEDRPPVADDSGVGQLLCPAGQELQGEFGCVQPQLPEETQGRAYG